MVCVRGMRALLRLGCILVLCSGAGCRDLVAFDDPKPPGIAPFRLDGDARAACETCARERCSDELAACQGDLQCRGLLECHSQCADPVCAARCGAYAAGHQAVQSSLYQLDRTVENPRFGLYSDCVAEANCRVECGVGIDWSCLGDSAYRWPTRTERAGDAGVQLRADVIEFTNYNGVPAQVAAYASDGTQLSAASTAGWGQAQLELRIAETFDGYLEIRPDSPSLGKQLAYFAPFFRPTRAASVVFLDNGERPSPKEGTAAIAVIAHDCLGIPAPGLTFELEQSVGELWYTTNRTAATPNATQTGLRGSGGVWNIPGSLDEVALLAKHAGDVVARRLIRVRADWLTTVNLYPRTEDE